MCSTAPRSEPAGLIEAARSTVLAQLEPAAQFIAVPDTNAPAPSIPSRCMSCRRVRFPPLVSSDESICAPLVSRPGSPAESGLARRRIDLAAPSSSHLLAFL